MIGTTHPTRQADAGWRRRGRLLAWATAAALALTAFSAPGPANAATTTVISDKASCEAARGVFGSEGTDIHGVGYFVCVLNDRTVASDETLTVSGTRTAWLYFNGLVNEGTIAVPEQGIYTFASDSVNKATIVVLGGRVDGRLDNGDLTENEGIYVQCGSTFSAVVTGNPAEYEDCTAPVVTPLVSGWKGANDWYVSIVEVRWSVSDPQSTPQFNCPLITITSDTTGHTSTCIATSEGGTTTGSVTIKRDATAPSVSVLGVVAGATYEWDQVPTPRCDASDATSGIASTSGPESGSGYGTRTVTCTATDKAGNTGVASTTFTVTPPPPPVVTPEVEGDLSPSGWYTSNVKVSWSVTGYGATAHCETTTINSDTLATDVSCSASNNVGGTTTETVTIKRDATAPVVSVLGVEAGAIYPLGAVPEPACDASDATSGLDGQAELVAPDLTTAGSKTVTCDADDVAGNHGRASVIFAVATAQDLIEMLKTHIGGLVDDGMLKKKQSGGLISPLDNAIHSLNRSKVASACSQMADFDSVVAEMVPPLDSAAADELLIESAVIRKIIGC